MYMINNLRKAIYPLVKSVCLYLNPFKNENTLYMMVTSAEGLKRIGTKVWDSITLEYLETLYKSMPMQLIAHGILYTATKFLLSAQENG